jgi:hypothetical protein
MDGDFGICKKGVFDPGREGARMPGPSVYEYTVANTGKTTRTMSSAPLAHYAALDLTQHRDQMVLCF